MKPAIADFLGNRWPLHLAFGLMRRIVKGKSIVRSPSWEPGFQKYERELAKWQWLREIVLDAEERRLRGWASENFGLAIPFGPFAGMTYAACERELSAASRLGFYEAELHPYVEEIVRRKYRRVVNIGCSFGYYAVGFARRMSDSEIFAFDINEIARERCRQLAEENGVADRIVIAERFDVEMFDRFQDERTLFICDIEGGERELLDPARSAALQCCDIVVELHDAIHPETSTDLPNRFRATHDVKLVREGAHAALELPEAMRGMGALERLVACHGGKRWGGTPWAVMWSHAWKREMAAERPPVLEG